MNYSEKWIRVLNWNLNPKNSAWSTGAIGRTRAPNTACTQLAILDGEKEME